MKRFVAPIIAIALLALVAATAATAGRSGRDPGVRAAQVEICPPSAKPSDGGNGNAGGNGNGGNGNGGSTPGQTPGSGGGNTDNGSPGSGNPGTGTGNSGGGNGSPGTGNSGNSGNGNSGNGNSGNSNDNSGTRGNGQGNGNSGTRGNGSGQGNGNSGGDGSGAECVTPPAEPAEGAVAGDGTLPPAEVGESVNVEPVDGVVKVKQPGADGFKPLDASAQLPEGTVLDTRAGTVELTTDDAQNGQQTAAFSGAKFQVRQRQAKSATELVLRGGDFRGCPRLDHGRRAAAIRNGFIAARGGNRRRLWGNGRGRFRTRGRWGSATVRGTVWQVEDRCDGTMTTVTRGVVNVRDFGLQRTVSVRAGEQYFAKVRP